MRKGGEERGKGGGGEGERRGRRGEERGVRVWTGVDHQMEY